MVQWLRDEVWKVHETLLVYSNFTMAKNNVLYYSAVCYKPWKPVIKIVCNPWKQQPIRAKHMPTHFK